jgi:hypothetical protein
MKNGQVHSCNKNGSKHLENSLHGLENEFDVEVSFKPEESDWCEPDPVTGVPKRAEPRIVLQFFVVNKNSPGDHKVLRYGLTRAAYGTELKNAAEAYPMSLKLALPVLESDLKVVLDGMEPDALTKVVMLNW